MGRDCVEKRPYAVRRMRGGLLQVAALGLLMALAMQGRAEERAIRSRVSPVYPEIAKRMRVTGVVKLAVTVDAGGNVTDVKTVSGNRTLATAAEEAVRKWRFAPAAAADTINLDVRFDLNE